MTLQQVYENHVLSRCGPEACLRTQCILLECHSVLCYSMGARGRDELILESLCLSDSCSFLLQPILQTCCSCSTQDFPLRWVRQVLLKGAILLVIILNSHFGFICGSCGQPEPGDQFCHRKKLVWSMINDLSIPWTIQIFHTNECFKLCLQHPS